MSYSATVVWLVDANETRAQEISSLINETVDIRCARQFDELAAVHDFVTSGDTCHWPDVLLIFAPANGDETAYLDLMIILKRLKHLWPPVSCVLADGSMDRRLMVEAIHAGANGVIASSHPYVKFVRVIRQAAAGGLWMDPMLARYTSHVLNDAADEQESAQRFSTETALLLAFMADGVTEQETVDVLQLSRRNIQHSLGQIYRALHRVAGFHFVA